MSARQGPLCLLSFDGGGIRGLSSLLILKRIMHTLENETEPKVKRPLLPCDYFDLIAGTSTGGLIAIMLGVLKMDVETCIEAYIEMAPKIFPAEGFISRNNLGRLVKGASGTARFDGNQLEKFIKELVVGNLKGAGEDALLDAGDAEGVESSCKTFVCATNADVGSGVRLRNYRSSWETSTKCTIWQAARATSAAPLYFDPVRFGSPPENYVDGGLRYNNPVRALFDESNHIWKASSGRKIGCIISIGTGVPPLKPTGPRGKEILESLAAIALDTQQTADEFFNEREHMSDTENLTYIRLNLDRGLEDIGLEEWKYFPKLTGATNVYLGNHKKEVAKCAKALRDSAQHTSRVIEPLHLAFVPKDVYSNCLSALYKTEYAAHLTRNKSLSGTCGWFLKHEAYQVWRDEQKSSLLWVSGDPGCGKSCLASFLVEKYQSSSSPSDFAGHTCYFFFKDENEHEKSATCAIASILHQLLTAKPSLIKHTYKDYSTKGTRFASEFDTLWRILMLCLGDETCGNIICVIDALDECQKSDQKIIMNAMVEFISKEQASTSMAPSLLKFVVTSRPYPEIERGLKKRQVIQLRGERETKLVSEDIRRVVAMRISDFGGDFLSKEDEMRLVDQLVENSDRTFLWVTVVLETLEESIMRSRGAIQNLIAALPKSVYGLYEKLLARASNQDDARKLLNIVLGATRPLSLREINVAFAIKAGNHTLKDLDLEPPGTIESTIKAICGLFLKVFENRVYFIHLTAKEFLLMQESIKCSDRNIWKHSMDPIETHHILAKICISYLLFDDFKGRTKKEHRKIYSKNLQSPSSVPNLPQNESFGADALHEYACISWAIHFRHCQYWDEDICHSAAYLYNRGSNSGAFWSWFYLWFDSSPWFAGKPHLYNVSKITNLMIASHFGHTRLAEFFVLNSVHITAQDNEGRTPLHWAALGGHVANLDLLLSKGAKIEEQTNIGQTALHCAARAGHTGAVRFLIQRKANILQKDKNLMTPLNLAALTGHTETVVFLLESVETTNEEVYEMTSLDFASYNGHDLVVEVLLKKDAELTGGTKSNQRYIEYRTSTGWTALLLAALRGRIEVLELLLKWGAKVNRANAQGRTALDLVEIYEDKRLKKMLLGYGALGGGQKTTS